MLNVAVHVLFTVLILCVLFVQTNRYYNNNHHYQQRYQRLPPPQQPPSPSFYYRKRLFSRSQQPIGNYHHHQSQSRPPLIPITGGSTSATSSSLSSSNGPQSTGLWNWNNHRAPRIIYSGGGGGGGGGGQHGSSLNNQILFPEENSLTNGEDGDSGGSISGSSIDDPFASLFQHEQQSSASGGGSDSHDPSSVSQNTPFVFPDTFKECESCEFFLFCWATGGLLDGACNTNEDGLINQAYRCCSRKHNDHDYQSLSSRLQQSQAIGTANFLDSDELLNEKSKKIYSKVKDCGRPLAKAERRIVGGDDAGFGNFPWQAYIRIGVSRCGGTLIKDNFVITAGHCVARAKPKEIRVILGDYVINSAVEPHLAYTFGVSKIYLHPLFKFTPQADRYDVAVLRLERSTRTIPHIVPICLPAPNENHLGEFGVASGWGALTPGSRLRPTTLQAVSVPVIDARQCEQWHRARSIDVTIFKEMLCAGYRNGGRDSCQGDSGGPLMYKRDNRWFLIGIISAGYSCARPGQPGIYHKVSHTVDWVNRILATSSP